MVRKQRGRNQPAGRTANRSKRPLFVAAAVLIAIAALLFARHQLREFAHRKAIDQLDRWALSSSLHWLSWTAWLGAGEGEVELLQAVCYRRWGQTERWSEALESAKRKGVPTVNVDREIALALIRSGEDHEWVDGSERELLESGVHPDDVAAAFVDRYVTRGEYNKATQFLDAWERNFPGRPHGAYLRGFYWLQLQMYDQAMERFQQAISSEPAHEPARKMIAELHEMQGRLDEALPMHLEAVRQAPTSEIARLGLARTLRKLNRLDEAREVLAPIVAGDNPLDVVQREFGQLELESGNYGEAQSWLVRGLAVADLDPEQLISAAISSHLIGETSKALQIVDRYEAVAARRVRGYDLQLRLATNPRDQSVVAELQRLNAEPSDQPTETPDGGDAAELYRRHCGACHGDNGDGNGRGARHLFPSPRNFRHDKFRIVSTRNGVPTRDDIERVIAVGLPGTSMPSFQNLPEKDRQLIASEVLRLHRAGLQELYAELARADGDEVDEDEVTALVARRFAEAESVAVPTIGPATSDSVARGAMLYRKLACHSCHGDDGSGATDVRLFDERGRPTLPRDFVHEPLKSGTDPGATYLRILLGMPGTPHPAIADLATEELVDLVHYCRSLVQDSQRQLTNYQRRVRSQTTAVDAIR